MQASYVRQGIRVRKLCRWQSRDLDIASSSRNVAARPFSGPHLRGSLFTRAVGTQAHPAKPGWDDFKATVATIAKIGAAAYVIQVYGFNSTMVCEL
jgi:hypothetical protein